MEWLMSNTLAIIAIALLFSFMVQTLKRQDAQLAHFARIHRELKDLNATVENIYPDYLDPMEAYAAGREALEIADADPLSPTHDAVFATRMAGQKWQCEPTNMDIQGDKSHAWAHMRHNLVQSTVIPRRELFFKVKK